MKKVAWSWIALVGALASTQACSGASSSLSLPGGSVCDGGGCVSSSSGGGRDSGTMDAGVSGDDGGTSHGMDAESSSGGGGDASGDSGTPPHDGGTGGMDSGTHEKDSGGGDDGGSGGGTTCSAPSPCTSTGGTWEQCSTSNGHSCVQDYYQTSDGQTFDCNGCASCADAVTELQAYCFGSGGEDGGGGGSTSCSSPVACGTTGVTYDYCETFEASNTCTQIVYNTTDGQEFACNGCDCSAAFENLAAYCSTLGSDAGAGGGGDGGSGGGTTCSASIECSADALSYDYCETIGPDETCVQITFYLSDSTQFPCSGCDCSAASTQVSDYCQSH